MLQADRCVVDREENWLVVRGVHVLVTKVGTVRAKPTRNLSIETGRIEDVRKSPRRVTNHQGLVEPFESGAGEGGVASKNGLADSSQLGRSKDITVNREADLQSRNCIRSREKGQVEGFMVVLIHKILH